MHSMGQSGGRTGGLVVTVDASPQKYRDAVLITDILLCWVLIYIKYSRNGSIIFFPLFRIITFMFFFI